MPLAPETSQIISQVESLSGRPVHVQEDPSLRVMATVTTARGTAPAHFVRYRPGVRAVDYLVAFQLGFLIRLFSCPPTDRWEVVASDAEQRSAIGHLGLTSFPPDFGRAMVGNIIVQMRTFAVGMRIDLWLAAEFPALRTEQENAARTQLIENERALAPEIRQQFPKVLVDTNSQMNAAFAAFWADELRENRYTIPYSALGYDKAARNLLGTLDEVSDLPTSDRALITRWSDILGLTGLFHFEPHILH